MLPCFSLNSSLSSINFLTMQTYFSTKVLINRKIRKIHSAMLQSRNCTRTSKTKQKRRYKVSDPAYARHNRRNTVVQLL